MTDIPEDTEIEFDGIITASYCVHSRQLLSDFVRALSDFQPCALNWVLHNISDYDYLKAEDPIALANIIAFGLDVRFGLSSLDISYLDYFGDSRA